MNNVEEGSVEHFVSQYKEAIEQANELDQVAKNKRQFAYDIRKSIVEKVNLKLVDYIDNTYQSMFDNVNITSVSISDNKRSITIEYQDDLHKIVDNIRIELGNDTYNWSVGFKECIVKYFYQCICNTNTSFNNMLTKINIYIDYDTSANIVSDKVFIFIYNKINEVLEKNNNFTLRDMLASYINNKFSFLPIIELDEMLERVSRIRLLESVK